MAQWAAMILAEERERHPHAVQLGELASLAAQIDSVLLRKLRLKLLPGVDVAAEADLWFGPLVQARGPRALLLRGELVLLLRAALAQDPQRLDAAYRVIQGAHLSSPAIIRCEEELSWAALRPPDLPDFDAAKEIQRLLGSVAATLCDPEQADDIAGWAARALPRLPAKVLNSPNILCVALAASSRLGGQSPVSLGVTHLGSLSPIPQLLPEHPNMVSVGISWSDSSLVVERSDQGAVTLALPLTNPLLLEISPEGGGEPHTLTIPEFGPVLAKVGSGPVHLGSLLGSRWVLQRRRAPLQPSGSVQEGPKAKVGVLRVLSTREARGLETLPLPKGPRVVSDCITVHGEGAALNTFQWEELLSAIRNRVRPLRERVTLLHVVAHLPPAAAALLGAQLPETGPRLALYHKAGKHRWEQCGTESSSGRESHTSVFGENLPSGDTSQESGNVILEVNCREIVVQPTARDYRSLGLGDSLAHYFLQASQPDAYSPSQSGQAADELNLFIRKIAEKYPCSVLRLFYYGPTGIMVATARKSAQWSIPVCIYDQLRGEEGVQWVPVLLLPDGDPLHGHALPGRAEPPLRQHGQIRGPALARLLRNMSGSGQCVYLRFNQFSLKIQDFEVKGNHIILRPETPMSGDEMLANQRFFTLDVPLGLSLYRSEAIWTGFHALEGEHGYSIAIPEVVHFDERRGAARVSASRDSYVEIVGPDKVVRTFALHNISKTGLAIRFAHDTDLAELFGRPLRMVIKLGSGPRLFARGEFAHVSKTVAGIECTPKPDAFYCVQLMKWMRPRLNRIQLETTHLISGRPAPLAIAATQGTPAASAQEDRVSAIGATPWPSKLVWNKNRIFIGVTPGGPFLIPRDLAKVWLDMPFNVRGRHNSDVLRPWCNAADVVGRPTRTWIIDFTEAFTSSKRSLAHAAYNHVEPYMDYQPYGYLRARAKPNRWNRKGPGEAWYLHSVPQNRMRQAIAPLARYLATPIGSKHRLFVWLDNDTLPGSGLAVIATSQEAHFAVLQSRIHELWVARWSPRLEDEIRYSPGDSFETFPFPAHGLESASYPVVRAAKALHEAREHWLNPVGLDNATLNSRTLNNLYNQRETGTALWLNDLHGELDRVVLDVYGWSDLFDLLQREERRLQADNPLAKALGPALLETEVGMELIKRLLELNRALTEPQIHSIP